MAPTFAKTDLPALRNYLDEAERLNRPVGERRAVMLLERLFLHYPQSPLSEDEQASRWDDFLADLVDVPEDVLELACTRWRRSDARFAPSPGQLLARVGGDNHIGVGRRRYAKRAQDVLELVASA